MPSTASMHELDANQVHYAWDNSIAPRLEIEPGDTVVFQTRDAADGFYSRASTHADVLNRGPFRGHPLTGPVQVKGAEPGDALVVEVLDIKPAADFGWTAIRPGRGLLPESEFSKPFLQIWDLSDGTHARMDRRVAVPIEAFPGVMGTALDEPGAHSTMPPRKNGGNMDIKQLTRDSTLYLPVWMPGALFSVGDGHGAQGDGEACGTAIECGMTTEAVVELAAGRPLASIHAETPAGRVTFGFSADLNEAMGDALDAMVTWLASLYGTSRTEALAVASNCVDLRVTQVANVTWGVHALLPAGLLSVG